MRDDELKPLWLFTYPDTLSQISSVVTVFVLCALCIVLFPLICLCLGAIGLAPLFSAKHKRADFADQAKLQLQSNTL